MSESQLVLRKHLTLLASAALGLAVGCGGASSSQTSAEPQAASTGGEVASAPAQDAQPASEQAPAEHHVPPADAQCGSGACT